MKKRIAIIMSVVLLIGSVVAYGDELAKGIVELIDYALLNSNQEEVDDLNIEILTLKQEDAYEEADKNNYIGGDRVSDLSRRIIVNVDTFNADNALRYEQIQKELNVFNLKNDIDNAMADIVITKKLMANLTLDLEYYKKDLKAAQTRYDLGLITQLALLEKENALQDKEFMLSSYESDLYTKNLELKRLLGIGFDEELTIDYDLIIRPLYSEEIEKNIESYVLNQLSVQMKKDTLAAKQMIFDYTAEFYDDYDKEYKEALYNLEIAKIDYKSAYDSEEISLLTSYNKLQTLYEAYDIAKDYVDLYTTKLNESLQKEKLGLISTLDVEYSKLTLRAKEYDAMEAGFDYNRELASFLNSIKVQGL